MNRGPAKSGVSIYSHNLDSLSSFYTEIITSSNVVFSNHEMRVLSVPDNQLVIHAFPADLPLDKSERTEIRVSAIKPFFTVENINVAKQHILELGGSIDSKIYRGPYFNVCNVFDPEGNAFMIREFFE